MHVHVFFKNFQGKFNFQGFSRQSCIFKYFSSLCEPCKFTKILSLEIKVLSILTGKVCLTVLSRLCCFFLFVLEKKYEFHSCVSSSLTSNPFKSYWSENKPVMMPTLTLRQTETIPRGYKTCWHFNIYEQDKFRAQPSWAWKRFHNLEVWSLCVYGRWHKIEIHLVKDVDYGAYFLKVKCQSSWKINNKYDSWNQSKLKGQYIR